MNNIYVTECVPDCCGNTETSSESVVIGNVLADVPGSQFFTRNVVSTFREDMGFCDEHTYVLERTRNSKFLEMLDGNSILCEDLKNIHPVYTRYPLFEDQGSHEAIPSTPPFQKQLEEEIVTAHLNADLAQHSDELSELNVQKDVQTVVTPSGMMGIPIFPRSCSSICSRSYKSVMTHAVDIQEAHLINSSPGNLEEGGSSHEPNSSGSVNLFDNLIDIQHAPADLPSFADDTIDQIRSVSVPMKQKKKRRRLRNREEVENQRMTHIALERNRRKQMKEHLSVLRSLMPDSYIQRGDQASVIGGAIEFVKELEHALESLQEQKQRMEWEDGNFSVGPGSFLSSFLLSQQLNFSVTPSDEIYVNDKILESLDTELFADSKSPVADVEVKIVGSDAAVKVLSQKRPGQLLKTIAAIENLHLTIMQLTITTVELTVLYSFSVKIGVECRLQTVSELAISIQQIFAIIDENSEE
eukprot:c12919_g1_i1 orf=862-2271(+)